MFDFLFSNYNNTPSLNIFIEFMCFILGVLSVWYARKQSILVYPTGLISTSLTVYLLFLTNDIGNMIVNIYFSLMSLYGWYNWHYGKTEGESKLLVSRLNFKQKILGTILGVFTFVLVWFIYKVFSIKFDTLTYLDLFTTSVFFTAMWYMALKKVESWVLWVIGNLIVIPLFAYRELLLLSLQYLILTILAITAFIEWNRKVKIK
jgi:nicotinamide mononucleotide transporter